MSISLPVGLQRALGPVALLMVLGPSTPAIAQTSSTSATAEAGRKTPTTTSAASSTRRARRSTTQARALRETQEPRFRIDELGGLVPDVRAEAAIVYDLESGEVLWESHSQDLRSIASITKVMTALVFLEEMPDLSETVVVQRSDMRAASTTYVRAGNRLSKGDLLHLALIASDNAAARVLARTSSLGSTAFVARMNSRAAELGLTSTTYVDPSGLYSDNVSSAYDMARLISYVSGDERIASIMRKQTHSVQMGRSAINVRSTNDLVTKGDVDVQAGKTGFIRKAGYCLATLLRLPQTGRQVAVVVLGARSNAGRFWETRHLFNWFATKTEGLLGMPLQAAGFTD